MKHSQSEMYPKAKKIHCVLCNGVVAFDKSSPERFSEHLRFDHEVSEGLDWVVAGSLISVETSQRAQHLAPDRRFIDLDLTNPAIMEQKLSFLEKLSYPQWGNPRTKLYDGHLATIH